MLYIHPGLRICDNRPVFVTMCACMSYTHPFNSELLLHQFRFAKVIHSLGQCADWLLARRHQRQVNRLKGLCVVARTRLSLAIDRPRELQSMAQTHTHIHTHACETAVAILVLAVPMFCSCNCTGAAMYAVWQMQPCVCVCVCVHMYSPSSVCVPPKHPSQAYRQRHWSRSSHP